MLWAKIAEAHNPREGKSTQAYIHSCTSEWNQTIYDPYVNVLRATTESMSAIMGGTDSLTVRPFDYAYKTTSKFSGRIARNIQIILKEEAYLDKIRDPGAGSYYIENLTDSIVNEAWKLFLTIENEGGYLEALKKGIIQNDIEAIQTLRKKNIASRKEVFLGTNQFPNILEKVRDEIVSEIAFPENSTTDYKVKPVKRFRGSEEFEKLRLAVENHPFGKPKVFLLTYGNPVMRKARADFSLNFFSCAGYEVINNQGFDSAKEGVEAAIKAKANIIVVCSSDEEYVRFAPEVNQLLNQKAYLVVAGAPSCMEELKKNGIEDFIHVKSNVLEVLTRFHKKLDIIS